ncbi:DUF1659 domain-containing protein [Desulfosporosinus sp. SB140]|uniref:DUF1659 domain-containing protein n=1 Tax=Desulfosporosinus paludis TaxID=3115649 RepID=UPI00388D04DA
MAVTVIPLSSMLTVKYQTGLTPEGTPVFKQKSLNNVSADATEQDAYDVAAAIFNLVQNPMSKVYLRKNYELANE